MKRIRTRTPFERLYAFLIQKSYKIKRLKIDKRRNNTIYKNIFVLLTQNNL